MKKTSLLLLASLFLSAPAYAEPVEIASPGGNLKVVVADGERLTWAVTEGGVPVLDPSPLGVTVDGRDLGRGTAIGTCARRSIAQDYPLLGHHAVGRNRANEISIPVASNGKMFILQVRAQDDGAAVRYLLPMDAKHLDGESTAWKVAGAKHAGWQDFDASYEGHDHWTPWAGVPENKRLAGLMTLEVAGRHLFLAEADNANYPDAAFTRQGDAITLSWHASPKGLDIDHAHLATPWRTMTVAKNLTELVNCDLLTNLCPPPAKGIDFSFVKPGRVLWQWCSVGAPKLADQHDWYDAAAKLGWEYYMIDDGWRDWRKDGKDQWTLLAETIAYGKSKGVETIIWVDSKELLKSPEMRRAYLAKVKASGAVGIKIDFLPPASEKVTAWCEEVLRDTAELKLMTIFHGCAKPTGRERTWPHALVREGIRGNEYHMTRYKRLAPMDHDVTQPFTRLLAGAGDVTPVVLDPAQLRGYTWPHMFAQGLTTLSPLACFYDKWSFYTESPAADLFREIPAVWDETRVLACTKIGSVAAFARRKGDTWWIGVVNGGQASKVEIPLDFLKKPTHGTLVYDHLLKDAALDRREREVAPSDSLEIALRPGGGFFARLGPSISTCPAAPLPSTVIPADTNHQPWVAPRLLQQKALAQRGGFDLMLLGDSITQGWGDAGRNALAEKMDPKFKSGNFGIGADRTENILWRLEHGGLDGALSPKVVMLMAGTNNLGSNTPQDIALGIQAIVDRLTARFPKAHILVLGVFPRRDAANDQAAAEINRVLPRLDDGKQVHVMDLRDIFLKDGKPDPALYADHVHLNAAGYGKWADKVAPVIEAWMR